MRLSSVDHDRYLYNWQFLSVPMHKHKLSWIIICFFILTWQAAAQPSANRNPEAAIYNQDLGLSFYPDYPPVIGEKVTLRIRTFMPALKVSLYTDREQEIPLHFWKGYWWGRFVIPSDYKEGWHFYTIWVKQVQFDPRGLRPTWSHDVIWYRAIKEAKPQAVEIIPLPLEIEFEVEKEEPSILVVTGEAVEIKEVSQEGGALRIKGNQTITFKSRNLEGSKEGEVPGGSFNREESLRVNVSGKVADTEIDANIVRTSAIGITQLNQQDENVSIWLRRASTEAYLGDFAADLDETEFTKLNRVLSGVRLKGDYEKWGFTALYSSPKGESKFLRRYGDGTQGPYRLDSSPVVIYSERVYLDGLLLKRGDDYTIDYQAGSITFLRKIIDAKSVLQVYYDYRQTAYQHATYGWQTFIKPNPNLQLRLTYLNDSDSLQGAQEIRQSMAQGAIDPQSHYVVGADGSLVDENISLNGEVAFSAKNLNLLSPSATQETGQAAKLDFSTSRGPFGITGHVERIGAKFSSVADPDPKQDVWEYNGGLSFRPGALFGGQGNYAYQRYRQSGVIYENLYSMTKAQLTPDRWPSLEYNYYKNETSNDPVTGASIRRIITRNSLESNYQRGFFTTAVKGTIEKWLNRSPSEEVTDYGRVNLGVATIGLEKFTFTSNVELENRKEPTGKQPYRRTYNLNLAASPTRQYFISSSFQVVDDSQLGKTNVTDLSYRAQPSEIFRTDGKYTINSVSEIFPTTLEAVSKQAGSFSFDLRPVRFFNLRYLFKPNFTLIERTQSMSYSNEQQQLECNLVPIPQALLGLVYKIGKSFTVYNQDYPNYRVKNNATDSDSMLYTIKMAPFQILSTEFNYLVDNNHTNTLASTQEPYLYNPGQGANRKYDLVVRTSLSERFSVDTRYTFQKTDQGSGEAASNIVNMKSDTASLKGNWNLSDQWTLYLSGAYTQTTDNLLASETYTYTPGFGAIYRWEDSLRVEFNYAYSKSYAGATTEKTNYSFRTKYGLSDYVNMTLQAEQEISKAPDYRLTDITGNIEINL